MNQAQIEGAGEGRGTVKSYLTGFALAIVLTVVAFGLVMSGAAPRPVTWFGIILAAIVQILVHLHFFLHLNRSSSERWKVPALLFTVLIMIIFIGGTIWIMHNLDYRMM